MGKLFIAFSKTAQAIGVDYRLKSAVRSAVSATLAEEEFPFDAEVSVTFCDNAHIRTLNNRFRGIDRHTDVLSFPMYDGEFPEEECRFGASLGDIVISLERAREQAEELGNTFYREVAFLAIHSTLHLLGYDHERSEEDDELQCEKQRKIIETLTFGDV
ncbi:MAG: rRNA maturation RNase YbeY [Clostridia bacterium]|nr:rRNA maturation RNase YbeY [Clostridia bacterium]